MICNKCKSQHYMVSLSQSECKYCGQQSYCVCEVCSKKYGVCEQCGEEIENEISKD